MNATPALRITLPDEVLEASGRRVDWSRYCGGSTPLVIRDGDRTHTVTLRRRLTGRIDPRRSICRTEGPAGILWRKVLDARILPAR